MVFSRGRASRRLMPLAVSVLIASAVVAAQPPTASAVTQTNGCFSPISSSWSTFSVPINGTVSADSIAAGGTVTLSNTTVGISVNTAIIQAGYTAGVVAVGANSVAATVKLSITGSNTVEVKQTATGTASISFDVAVDPVTDLVSVTPDPVGATVNVSDTTWTSTGGGSIVLAEAATSPASATVPSIPDRNIAALQILNKVNNAISANFYCWPGNGSTSFAASGAAPIATVNVASDPNSTTTTTVPGDTTTTTAVPTSSAPSTTAAAGPTTTTAPAVVGGDYITSCTNSVTPDKSSLGFTITGSAPASAVQGSKVAVTGQSWKVSVPGSVLDAGIGLDLLHAGDIVPGAVDAVVTATNATPASATAAAIPISLGPVQVDDQLGTAKDASVSFAVPDMSFTAKGGRMDFALGVTKVKVTIGPLVVTFTCTATSGLPFAATAVSGVASAVTPPRVASTTQTTDPDFPNTGMSGSSTAVIVILALAMLELGLVLWRGVRRRRSA